MASTTRNQDAGSAGRPRRTQTDRADEIIWLAGRRKDGYQNAKARLARDLETDPASAITRLGEDMVIAQVQYELLARYGLVDHEGGALPDAAAVMAATTEMVEHIAGRLLTYGAGPADRTGHFRHAVDQARIEGLTRLYRSMKCTLTE